LDESPETILEEALSRVKGAIDSLPEDKRYSRFHYDEEASESTELQQ
jgi:hypothetical protein